jgi:hypothetical protein
MPARCILTFVPGAAVLRGAAAGRWRIRLPYDVSLDELTPAKRPAVWARLLRGW